ncbi:MAG: ATP synthase A1, C subunit [Halonotius sp. J07HN6]|jgi:ATP synthase A1, C subunit|nr:MAG: ATP synthase A1, C subunit [Halonotius sp. J07HN6]
MSTPGSSDIATSGSSNPEYVTARARARRGALFDDDEYSKLVRMSPSEIARYMEESEYEQEINELGSRHSGVDLIEYSLNRNLARHFGALLRFAEGQLYNLIARYLRKFDAWNVKTVLRGVYTDTDREAVETDLIRAGEFDEARLSRLLEVDTVEDIVTVLDGTIFDDAVQTAFEDFQETNTLVPLENAVDRAFYEQLLGTLPSGEAISLYREFLEAEIDFRNVRNALRLARSGADIDPGAYFIDGGRLFTASEMTALVQNTEELVTRIRESTYGDRLAEPLDELAAADSLIDFERALEGVLLEYSRQLGNEHPLSICPVVAYILMKEREVTNIRAIARGREAGLGDEEIEQELVIL